MKVIGFERRLPVSLRFAAIAGYGPESSSRTPCAAGHVLSLFGGSPLKAVVAVDCAPADGTRSVPAATWLHTTIAGLILVAGSMLCMPARVVAQATTEQFAREVEASLPQEKPYDFHKRLSTAPVHLPRRDSGAKPMAGELALPSQGWKLLWDKHSSMVLENAVRDFQDYLSKSMQVGVTVERRDSLADWQTLGASIVVGTRDQMPGLGASLKGPKDYEIVVGPDRVAVCGFDERGAMFGLYNLEARLNLREGPFLPADLKTVRHSLYDVRMVQSWMGWMEWPDALLSHLAHDGFDGIFASCYANPNGDRTTAESSTEFYARLLFQLRRQDPARMHDLVRRASRYGIKVYTPIVYQYLGTPESEAGASQACPRHGRGVPRHPRLHPSHRRLLV